MKNRFKYLIISLLLIASIVGGVFYINKNNNSEYISYTTFLEQVEKGKVKTVKLSDSPKIGVILKDSTKLITDNPRTLDFKKELLTKDIEVIEENMGSRDIAVFLALTIGLFIFIVYLKKNRSKEAEREINSLSKIDSNSSNTRIRFKDVAGNEEAKESLEEMVEFINNPDIYNNYGARLPRGVLLYGPPGTGKTLLAKALAGEAGVPIFPVSGSDFVQVYAGLGASRIRELFKTAKSHEKAVIFIDEIDSLGKKRKGSNTSGSEEGDRTLNALLAEMSGFKENQGVIVIAATNRIDVLDDALLRPGRFDRQIEVELPDVNAREKILKLHSRNKPISQDIDFKKLASETIYFSGAKLENLLNESAMYAVKDKSLEITNDHVEKAYFKTLVGDEKKIRTGLNKEDIEITAFHEAGHALVAKKTSDKNRVTKVSIIPSTKGIGGFSLNIPPEKMYQNKTDILNNIKIALGGRAAEDIIFGRENITTGASSDLEKATDMILSMIGIYGMDEDTGLLNLNVLVSKNLNQDSSIISRSKKILEDIYLETVDLLKSNKKQLEKMATELINKEVLSEDEINEILDI